VVVLYYIHKKIQEINDIDRACHYASDKHAINLQKIHRQISEVNKRRQATSKTVEKKTGSNRGFSYELATK
jgi:hypothetical protein